MATESQFPKTPPLRFELTEERATAMVAARPPGDAALIVGYHSKDLERERASVLPPHRLLPINAKALLP